MLHRLVVIIVLVVLLQASMEASDELLATTNSTQVTFASADNNKTILIFAKRRVRIGRAEILWLNDQSTGRGSDLSLVKIAKAPGQDDIVPAGEFARFRLEVAPRLDKNTSLDGQFGISYEVVPDLSSSSDKNGASVKEIFIKNFALLGTGVSALPVAANASLDFVTSSGTPSSSVFLITGTRTFDVCVIARSAAIVLIGERIDVFDATDNLPLEPSPITLEKAPSQVGIERPVCMSLKQQPLPVSAMKVTGTLVVLYRAPNVNAEVRKAIWSFELVRPAAQISIGLNGVFAVPTVLEWPWRDQAVHKCIPYFSTPAQATLDPNVPLQADIYVDKQPPTHPDGVRISAWATADRELCLDAIIPRGLTSAKGRIQLKPPSVIQPMDVLPLFQLKAHPIWRLMTAIAAYTLALLIYVLTTGVRNRLEHRAARASISLRLARFLATNPNLTDHDSITFIRQLLVDSEQQDRRDDLQLASETIASADSRMGQLETAPPTVATDVNAPSAGEIRVRNASDQMISGRTITFQIGHRLDAWTPGCIFTWKIGRSPDTMTDAGSGSEKTSIAKFFPVSTEPANWTVEVSANNASASRIITLAADEQTIIRRIQTLNLLPHVLAISLAALAAYIATNAAETWGTSTDYLNLFLAAFGISGGVQSFAVILQTLQR